MADTTALKNRIRAAIKTNGNQEITGPVLQQTLLDIVDELDLYPELQEAINTEKNTRQQADTQLNNLITGIKNNIDNGYVYAGIATPSTTPVSGKVFYIATAAGTYTNFGGQVLTQGINILCYNDSAWSHQQLIGIDDEPTAVSENLVKSGGINKSIDSLKEEIGTIKEILDYDNDGSVSFVPVQINSGSSYIIYVKSEENVRASLITTAATSQSTAVDTVSAVVSYQPQETKTFSFTATGNANYVALRKSDGTFGIVYSIKIFKKNTIQGNILEEMFKASRGRILQVSNIERNSNNDFDFTFRIVSSDGQFVGKDIVLSGSGHTAFYFLSSTENEYTPYFEKLIPKPSPGLECYIVSSNNWDFLNGKDFRDFVYAYDPNGALVGIPLNDKLNDKLREYETTFSTGERVNTIGIDTKPVAGSNSLVKSGGVAGIINDLITYQGINVIKDNVEGEKMAGQLFNTDTKQYVTWPGATESLTITSGFVIGQTYLFTGMNYQIPAYKPVCFLDSSGNIIEAYYEEGNVGNRFVELLEVPTGTSKIVVNGKSDNNDTSAGMYLLVKDYNYSLNIAKAQLNANCFKIAGSGLYSNQGYLEAVKYSVFYGNPIQVIEGNTLTIQSDNVFHLTYYSDLSVFTSQTCVEYNAVKVGYDNYVTKVPVGAKVAIISIDNLTNIRVINTNKSINNECLIPVKQLSERELALDYSFNLKYDTVKNPGTNGVFAPVIFDENKYIFASHASYKLIGYLNCGIGAEDMFISINTDSAAKVLTVFRMSYNTVRYKNYSLVFSEYPESDFLIYKTEYDETNKNIIVSGIDSDANKIQAVAKVEGSTENETAHLQGLCKNCIKCSGFVAYVGYNYISYGVYNTLGEGWIKYKFEFIKWENKTGVVFGDSLTHQGYYVSALRTNFAMTIENCAVSGTCYTNSLNPKKQPIHTQIANAQTESPDFVFIMGGTNDYSLQNEIGDYQDITDDTVCGGCYLAFSAIRQKWPLVPVFVGLIPYRDTGGVYTQMPAGIDGNDANHTLLKYNNAIEVMARRFGFNVIDSMQCGIGPGNIGTYYQDGLHFNTAGGIRYAQFLADEMNIITPY